MTQHTSSATDQVPILLTIHRQLVTVEGRLPFDILKEVIETTRSDGRVQHRSVGQSLLRVGTPDTLPQVRLPLLPLLEAELRRRGVAYEVVAGQSHVSSMNNLRVASQSQSYPSHIAYACLELHL